MSPKTCKVDATIEPPADRASYSRAYKRYVIGLFLTAYIFNQTDRAVFGFLMEPIKREFSLSDGQLGFLAGPALVLFYATLGMPIAKFADRGHRINIMSVAIALWSAIVTASALVANFWQLALARIGVGVGEAGFSAVAQAVIADYHTTAERTRALSIFLLGIPLGGVVSNLMGGWINQIYGWRAVFIAAGVPGLILALLVKRTIREPSRALSQPLATPQTQWPTLRHVFVRLWQRRSLRHLVIATTLSNLIPASMAIWLPAFFIRSHDMETGALGVWLALITGAGGGLGMWLSGYFARLPAMADQHRQARLLAASVALIPLLFVAGVLWPGSSGALVLMLPVSVLNYFFYAPSNSLLLDLSATGMRATLMSIVIFCQTFLAGVVGLQLTGLLSDALAPYFGTHALRWALITLSPAALWAAVHFWLAARSIERETRDNDCSPRSL